MAGLDPTIAPAPQEASDRGRALPAGPESLTFVNTLALINWSRTNRLELFAIRNSAWDSNGSRSNQLVTILSVAVTAPLPL
jgi:hypothetical protein